MTEQQITDVYEFEGDEVTTFTAQIPSTKLEVEEQWPRGTVININTTFRIRSVRIEEDRHGNLTRHHILALEEAQITNTLTPKQRKAQHDAAVAAEQAAQGKVIEEEPGREDQPDAEPGPAQSEDPVQAPDAIEDLPGPQEATEEPQEVRNDLVTDGDADTEWADVDERDQAKRDGLQVEEVERVDDPETEDTYEAVGAEHQAGF